ncbi:MAG: PCMD domain-containing protein [Bacteroidales bacterium]|nr:PCMD domain-containing protein [Bacteroidales bacterium]
MSINFSSGAYGDLFQGEAGSTLLVDNVRLIYE